MEKKLICGQLESFYLRLFSIENHLIRRRNVYIALHLNNFFKILRLDELIKEIEKGKIKYSEDELISKKYSKLSIDLIKKLLTLDPDQRLSAAEALKHPWIASFLI